jgi:RNA polymerase sigma-70 factor (ECF subfamily)
VFHFVAFSRKIVARQKNPLQFDLLAGYVSEEHMLVEVLQPERTAFRKSLDALYRDHGKLVYRAAYSILGNPDDAKDVLQTVFLRLVRLEAPELRSGFHRSPQRYLHRAAVNEALHILESGHRRMRSDEDVECLEIETPPNESSYDNVMIRRLQKVMTKLDPDTVSLLMLRYDADFNNAQIAEMMGTSRSAVAMALMRARRRLKKMMRLEERHHEK